VNSRKTRAGDLALVTVDASGDTRYDYAALDARVRAGSQPI